MRSEQRPGRLTPPLDGVLVEALRQPCSNGPGAVHVQSLTQVISSNDTPSAAWSPTKKPTRVRRLARAALEGDLVEDELPHRVIFHVERDRGYYDLRLTPSSDDKVLRLPACERRTDVAEEVLIRQVA